MSRSLAEREPTLEWSLRSASGELRGLTWVDPDVDPGRTPFRQWEDEDGERRFHHLAYTAFLPPPLAEAAGEAQRRGTPTVHEALLLVYARLEWLIAARKHLWSPLTPTPALLTHLVESFGVDPALHRGDPAILARLVAMLPRWYRERGTVEKAREMLDACESDEQAIRVAYLAHDGALPRSPDLRDEVLAGRSTDWWRRRRQPDTRPYYRIVKGFLRFQPPAGSAFEMQQEDVLVEWRPDTPLTRNLMRLLPVWTEFRLVLPRSS